MLDDAQVRLLLAHVMAYDNRKPGQATVAAWSEAARRARWTYPEALDAVHAHYAERTEWLMPGAITAHIRVVRQDTAMRAPVVQPEPLPPGRFRELVAGAFRAITTGNADDPAAQQRRDAMARACGYCGAQPGKPCTRASQTGRARIADVHPSRQEVR